MKNKSGYTIFGYVLIIVGILLPLVGFFSMSYRSLGEGRKYDVYLAENSKTDPDELAGIEEYNSRIKENYIVDPFDNEKYSQEYDFYRDNPDEVFAYLVIEKLDIKKPIYLDASDDHLSKGVAHVYGTSLPVGGEDRRSVIAGHRGWYGDVMFLNVHKLEPGDEMVVVKDGEKMTYIVSDLESIYPDQWDELQPREGEDMLTLLTCEPLRPPRDQRLLVNGVRKESEILDEEVEVEIENSPIEVEESIKRQNSIIYAITGVLVLLLMVVVVRFVKYMVM